MRYCGTSLGLALLLAFPLFAPAQLATTIQMGKPDKPIVGSPYTADMTVTIARHLPDGILVNQTAKGHLYRSADGVERYEGTFPSTNPDHPDPVTMVYILDRAKHTSITLNSNLKTAYRQALPDPAAITVSLLPLPRPTGPDSQIKPENPTTVDLGTRNVGMLEIHGKLATATIPAGKIGNPQPLPVTAELWMAPKEKILVKQVDKNPLTGERTFELTNIRAEEPDPALFQIPEDYTVKDRPAIPVPPQAVSLSATSKPPEQRTKQIEDALNSPDPIVKNMAEAAEDTRNAGVASGYVTELAAAGDDGETRLAASRAAAAAEVAAAAAETAAAAVEADASKATAASAAGDRAAANSARDKAVADYSALLAADDQLAKAATDLISAAAGNATFFAANPGTTAINDMGAQDSSAAANLLSAAAKGGTAGYSAAVAKQATAVKDANIMASLDPTRTAAFKAVVYAEVQAQSAAMAAAAGGGGSAAAAEAEAATAGATADGPGNPYAGAVENGAAAIAHAASATISAQHAMDRLKTLK